MSKEEILCASLDNQGEGELLKNSNTMCAMQDEISQNHVENLDSTDPDISTREDSDRDEYEEDIMTGSYGEISLDQELLGCTKGQDSPSSKEDEKFSSPSNNDDDESTNEGLPKENKRPDSLVLSKNSTFYDEGEIGAGEAVKCVHKSQQTLDSLTNSVEGSPALSSDDRDLRLQRQCRSDSDTSGLSELQGTLTVDGDMVMFVAEDLQKKIKMSSPVSRWAESSSYPGSRSSTPSLYQQALQTNVHFVDPNVVTDLESHAKKVASCVDRMLENLTGTLQSISSLTVECMETYEQSVCKTCDAVDANIKAVYQLMAKCEELSNSMDPLYKISDNIKSIKRNLDHLEHVVEHKS